MTDEKEDLRSALMRRLLEGRSKLPTGTFGRARRTAGTALRIGRRVLSDRFGSADGEVDVDALARIVSSVGEMKGLAMKLGQIMSYIDIALPSEVREALSVLQTHAPPMPVERVREILREELGASADALLATLEPAPIAAASIGQVHRAKLPDGTGVAIKVQYPEVRRAIETDLRPAAFGTAIASVVYPGAAVDEMVAEARARFLEECDYRHEAAAQTRFCGLFAGDPVIVVPEVHEAWSSSHVLTTTLLSGVGLEAFVAGSPGQALRDKLGEALFGFYVGSLFEHRLYNCDPHPGNYLFLPDGRLGVLDYGCTREFEPAFVAKLARLTRAVHADDRAMLHAAFVDLGMVRDGAKYDFDTARGLVRGFYGPMLRDVVQTIDLGEALQMRDIAKTKRQLLKLKLPGEFLFLFRIRFGLMSVLARLGARANWYRLERSFLPAAE